MKQYTLVKDNDPILSQPAERFDFDNPPMDPTELFEDMKRIMQQNHGFGLSAPQIGVPYQVFVLGNPYDGDSIFSVFNPKIVDTMGDTFGTQEIIMEEGCLTYPGMFIKIKRPASIRARFSGHDGVVDTMNFNGYTARAFLHEYDHLQGVTFVNRASKLQLDRAKKKKVKLDRMRKQNV